MSTLEELRTKKAELDKAPKSEDRDKELRKIRAQIRKLGGTSESRGSALRPSQAPPKKDNGNGSELHRLENRVTVLENRIDEAVILIKDLITWKDKPEGMGKRLFDIYQMLQGNTPSMMEQLASHAEDPEDDIEAKVEDLEKAAEDLFGPTIEQVRAPTEEEEEEVWPDEEEGDQAKNESDLGDDTDLSIPLDLTPKGRQKRQVVKK